MGEKNKEGRLVRFMIKVCGADEAKGRSRDVNSGTQREGALA